MVNMLTAFANWFASLTNWFGWRLTNRFACGSLRGRFAPNWFAFGSLIGSLRSLKLGIMVVFLVVASITAMGQYTGGYSNVAFGKTASASNYAGGYPPSDAVNGSGGLW